MNSIVLILGSGAVTYLLAGLAATRLGPRRPL